MPVPLIILLVLAALGLFGVGVFVGTFTVAVRSVSTVLAFAILAYLVLAGYRAFTGRK
jgi:hypothetical protein